MPAIALRDNVVLQGMIIHIDIGRQKSVKAVERAMMMDQELFLVAQKDPQTENPAMADLYAVGTICHIRQIVKMPKNQVRIMVEGVSYASLQELFDNEEYMEARVLDLDDGEIADKNYEEALLQELQQAFVTYAAYCDSMSEDTIAKVLDIEELGRLTEQIGILMSLPVEKKQLILEADGMAERAECLIMLLENETTVRSIRRDITEKLKNRLDKNQKDYVLREQIKVIREELGEEGSSEADRFAEKLTALEADDDIKSRIMEEISKLRLMMSQSPEYFVERNYIDTLLKMPWNRASEDNTDLARARSILDRDHYGLEKAKERILEFLAVRSLTGKEQSSILCLVGPPGTGKTSIGKSIAEALGKKYIRFSLGGVNDEAEIRGHRRTYIGAMPGRIASAIRKAGVKNPVIVLDEIDKLSSGRKGETSSAMLEVLDPEQNKQFEDHYIELPIDLSEVFFITTANDAQSIPQPLYDRMEVIEVSSYTDNEKWHIAREHLVPKMLEESGLRASQLKITDKALEEIISRYTREAGVRTLERRIGAICRKAARMILEENKKRITVSEKKLGEFLGQPVHTVNPVNQKDEVGIVRGLAWTSAGGETLEVEVNLMPGEGDFILTGQLGDVMKESAQAGISYIRSSADKLHISEDAFKKNDIHIHIPEGAVPKDGPSAGVTMITAMVSAFTEIPVRANLAMTGEITLRGRILPIGGLKEKLLAAKKAGITRVLVPEENRSDIKEISHEITDGMDLVCVSSVDQVLREALVSYGQD